MDVSRQPSDAAPNLAFLTPDISDGLASLRTEAEEVDMLFGELVASRIVCEGEVAGRESSSETRDNFRAFLLDGGYEQFALDEDTAYRAYLVFSEIANNSNKYNPLSKIDAKQPADVTQRYVTLGYSPHETGTIFLAFFDWGTVDEGAFETLEAAYDGTLPESQEALTMQIGAASTEERAEAIQTLDDLEDAETGASGRLKNTEDLDKLLELLSPSGRGLALIRTGSDARGIEHISEDDGSPEGVVQWFVFKRRKLSGSDTIPEPRAA